MNNLRELYLFDYRLWLIYFGQSTHAPRATRACVVVGSRAAMACADRHPAASCIALDACHAWRARIGPRARIAAESEQTRPASSVGGDGHTHEQKRTPCLVKRLKYPKVAGCFTYLNAFTKAMSLHVIPSSVLVKVAKCLDDKENPGALTQLVCELTHAYART